MSAEVSEIVPQPDLPPEVNFEEKARAIGWVDKAEYKGSPDKWVDAKTYVERGEQYIPFLRATNKKLETKLGTLEAKIRAQDAALAAIQESTEKTAKAATEDSIKDLRAQIVQAQKDGDLEKAEELREQLDDQRASLRQRPAAQAPTPAGAGGQQLPPEWNEWLSENGWWNDDPAMRAASVEISRQMALRGEITEAMPYRERLDRISAATKARFHFGENERRVQPSRVEGSRASGGSNSGGARGYSDLPPEAKAACDRPELVNRLVGEGKKFKDIRSWRESYANKYFEG